MPQTTDKGEASGQQHSRFYERAAPTHQESARRVEVDEKGENGVIYDVLVLGNDERGMARYPAEAQKAAVMKYDGVPTYIGHTRDGSNPDYTRKLGVHRNPRTSPEGIRTDFCFNAHHPQASQLIFDAKNAPNTLGFSHDADCTWHREGGKRVVDSIDKVHRIDLVTRGGTVRGLFEDEEITDESRRGFVESALSALDNARTAVLDEAITVEQSRDRFFEAVREFRGVLCEGEIADEMAKDEPRRKMRRIRDTAERMLDQAFWDGATFPTHEDARKRHLTVLADWSKELKSLECGSTMKEEQIMDEDLKTLTVETLAAKRPDLVSKIQGTDEVSRLTEEAKTLKATADEQAKRLAELEAKESTRLKEERLTEALKAANFPVANDKAFTARFREECLAMDEKDWPEKIADRMGCLGAPVTGVHPSPLGEMRFQEQERPSPNNGWAAAFGINK